MCVYVCVCVGERECVCCKGVVSKYEYGERERSKECVSGDEGAREE